MSAMNLRSSQTQADVEAKAREWFIRLLDEDVAREELLAWGAWLDADASHRAAYERVEDAWQHMRAAEATAPDAEELAADRYVPDLSVSQWRKARRARLKLVSSIVVSLIAVLSVALVGWFWANSSVAPPQQFATQRARHTEAHLPDGSRIQLGAMTTLNVAFSARHREVGMVGGEALFHVAHDHRRPFVVRTPLAAITAVGTAFDVDIETHAVTLTVTEGVVSVAPDPHANEAFRKRPRVDQPIRIRAGQNLRMEWDGAHLILALSDSQSGATWTDGRLEYRNTPLRSVIDDVNRYTTKPIIIADPNLAYLQYTGTVQLEAADTWALGLPAAFPLTVELNDRGEFVLRQKSAASLPVNLPSGTTLPSTAGRPRGFLFDVVFSRRPGIGQAVTTTEN
ncbi:MAG TPA: FecR domain-containing protein [Caulobacteraceae bacterium]|jgi:transmembrane sensor|nr:FecR domain-containing protein [Caulobacteraceae bacterium]